MATVRHAHLWGVREVYEKNAHGETVLSGGKYHWLWQNDVRTTRWTKLKPQSPFYLFVPQDTKLRAEYEQGWKVTEMMPVSSVGIVTARDELAIHWREGEVWSTVTDFAALPPEEARAQYNLGKDARDWQVAMAQKDVRASGPKRANIKPILYRPFDIRYTYYTGHSRGFHCMPRGEVMRHMLAGENLGLSTTRSVEIGRGWEHVFCTRHIIQHHTVSLKEVNYLFPLYLYRDGPVPESLFDYFDSRRPNLASEFVDDFAERLQMKFVPDGRGSLKKTFGPEAVFHYMYAIFHSPTYRRRYTEFLKIDFPRLPLTSNADLFRALCRLGGELVGLHLMEKHAPIITHYPIPGDNTVETVRYTEPGQGAEKGRVWINKMQYFEGVPPEVWNFHVGGYRVSEKWLKDRKGRQLTYDGLTYYQRVVTALWETMRLMAEIDKTIHEHGGWPIQ